MQAMQLGRKLGFPTANLSAHSEQFPPNGVYAAEAQLDGEMLRGVVNLGVRPTIEARRTGRACSNFISSTSIATFTATTSKLRFVALPAAGAEIRERGCTSPANRMRRATGARIGWSVIELGASKIQPGQISYLGRLANGENDSERANDESATKREDQQQPNREVRHLNHSLANQAAATGKEVSHSGSD